LKKNLGYFLRKFATFEMIWATNRKDFLATLASPWAGILENRISSEKLHLRRFRGGYLGVQKW